MLTGRLLDVGSAPVAAAAHALRVLAAEGGRGMSTDQLVADHPVLLALVPPAIGGHVELPRAPATMPALRDVDQQHLWREALRLRARWLHELTAHAAIELGTRLHAANRIPDPADVRWLTYEALCAVVAARSRSSSHNPCRSTSRLCPTGSG